jgi:hypothetical protein
VSVLGVIAIGEPQRRYVTADCVEGLNLPLAGLGSPLPGSMVTAGLNGAVKSMSCAVGLLPT